MLVEHACRKATKELKKNASTSLPSKELTFHGLAGGISATPLPPRSPPAALGATADKHPGER